MTTSPLARGPARDGVDWASYLVEACLVALVGLSVAPALIRPANPDAAWLVYLATRWLDGIRPYRDLVEINPPLIIWLSTPAVVIGHTIGVLPSTAFTAMVGLVAGGCLVWSAVLLRKVLPGSSGARGLILLALAVALFTIPGDRFGEREHLAVLLTIPYLLTLVLRAHGKPVSRLQAVGVGVIGAIGFCLKPHFVLVWLALEALLVLGRRSWRSGVRPESILVALGGIAYLLIICVAYPEYLALVGRYANLYSHFAPLPPLMVLGKLKWPLLAVGAWAVARLCAGGRGSWFGTVLAVTTTAWIAVATVQQKNFPYHRYPAEAHALVLAAVVLATSTGHVGRRRYRGRSPRLTLGVAGLALASVGFATPTTLQAALAQREAMAGTAAMVRRLAHGGTIAAFAIRLDPWFPLVEWADIPWGIRYNMVWFADGSTISDDEAFARHQLVSDLVRSRPGVVFVDTTLHFQPWLAYLRGDPSFVPFWAAYHQVGTLGPYAIYARYPAESHRPLDARLTLEHCADDVGGPSACAPPEPREAGL